MSWIEELHLPDSLSRPYVNVQKVVVVGSCERPHVGRLLYHNATKHSVHITKRLDQAPIDRFS